MLALPFEALTALDVVLMTLTAVHAAAVGYALFVLAERTVQTRGRARVAWLVIGSVALGVSAFVLSTATMVVASAQPQIRYSALNAANALGLGLAAVCFALTMLLVVERSRVWAAVGGLGAGAGLAIMHFTGMSAAGWAGIFSFNPRIAIGAVAAAALAGALVLNLVTVFSEGRSQRVSWRQALAGLFVLAGLAGAYLISFAAADVAIQTPGDTPIGVAASLGLRDGIIAVTPRGFAVVAAATLGVLCLLVLSANADRRIRQRRAETEALRRSEDRFRSLVQASSQIVWTTAPDGQMVGEQASWSAFTGQEAAAYRGWGWFNAVHPEDRERTAAIWEEALANRRPVEVEHRVSRHDGRYRDCLARVVPVLEADGRVREWVGTHTDITDRARMQQERDLLASAGRVLSSSLDEPETLSAIAGLLVPQMADWCTIDIGDRGSPSRRVAAAHVDPQRLDLLRQLTFDTRPAPGAHPVMRVFEQGESELFRRVTDEVLRDIAPDPEQRRAFRDVGMSSLIWVPLTARGQVLGVLTLALRGADEPYDLRDLALAEELARRSAIAIDNARLYSTSQAAIRARDDILGIVSHDLRNPLGTITTTADMLIELNPPPDDRQRYMQMIRRSAKTMDRLINDLLDVTQTENGTLALDTEPIDAAAIVAEACDLMRPIAAEKSQRLESEIRGGLPAIQADARRMQQVLSNLIGNAIKFSDAGGEVRVEARPVEEGVHYVVSDNGPGISPEDLTRLFDRHWRAPETAHMGAGLGLAISRGIVEAHGGRIWAESRPGNGTQLHFIVPRARADEAREAAQEAGAVVDTPAEETREDEVEVATAGPPG